MGSWEDYLHYNDVKTLEVLYNRPWDELPPDIKQSVKRDINSHERRRETWLRWLEYVGTQSPALVDRKPALLRWLQSYVQTKNLSQEQVFFLSFLTFGVGNMGFPPLTLSRLNISVEHGPHYEFRNEWWCLSGKLQDADNNPGFLSLYFWRHTDLPQPFWDDQAPSTFSSIKCLTSWVLPGSTEIQYGEPFTVAQSWGASKLQSKPFGLHVGLNYITSASEESIFPMRARWSEKGQTFSLRLNNDKSLTMFHSNGCVFCSDGVGIKKYIYPSVKGEGEWIDAEDKAHTLSFQGFWEHSWESGTSPQGFNQSIFLRSFMNIERSFREVSSLDDGTFITCHWGNGWQLSVYLKPNPREISKTYSPAEAFLSNPDGERLSLDDLSLQVDRFYEHRYPVQITLRTTKHTGELVLKVPFLSAPYQSVFYGRQPGGGLAFMNSPVNISGSWRGESTTGFGFINMVHSGEDRNYATFDAFSEVDTGEKTYNRDHMSPGIQRELTDRVNQGDTVASWLVWIFPLIVLVFLFVFIFYLIWVRVKASRHPWIRAATYRHHIW